MKVTTHFHVAELVHPKWIEQHGEQKMKFILEHYAQPMLRGLEDLRLFVDRPVIVNDWHRGGAFRSSGLRHHDDPVGAELSAHYFLLACDCKVKGWNIADLQNEILNTSYENPSFMPYIVRMENAAKTPTWLHLQFGYRMPNEAIQVFMP